MCAVLGCVVRDVLLLTHPVVSRLEQCMSSMWLNVGQCTKINCVLRQTQEGGHRVLQGT